jgi:hypothetical protein
MIMLERTEKRILTIVVDINTEVTEQIDAGLMLQFAMIPMEE